MNISQQLQCLSLGKMEYPLAFDLLCQEASPDGPLVEEMRNLTFEPTQWGKLLAGTDAASLSRREVAENRLLETMKDELGDRLHTNMKIKFPHGSDIEDPAALSPVYVLVSLSLWFDNEHACALLQGADLSRYAPAVASIHDEPDISFVVKLCPLAGAILLGNSLRSSNPRERTFDTGINVALKIFEDTLSEMGRQFSTNSHQTHSERKYQDALLREAVPQEMIRAHELLCDLEGGLGIGRVEKNIARYVQKRKDYLVSRTALAIDLKKPYRELNELQTRLSELRCTFMLGHNY